MKIGGIKENPLIGPVKKISKIERLNIDEKRKKDEFDKLWDKVKKKEEEDKNNNI